MSSAMVGLIGAVAAAALTALVSWLLGRRKARVEPAQLTADAAALLTSGYATLVADLRKQIESLEARILCLEKADNQKDAEISNLKNRLEELEVENAGLREENSFLRLQIIAWNERYENENEDRDDTAIRQGTACT